MGLVARITRNHPQVDSDDAPEGTGASRHIDQFGEPLGHVYRIGRNLWIIKHPFESRAEPFERLVSYRGIGSRSTLLVFRARALGKEFSRKRTRLDDDNVHARASQLVAHAQ